MRKYTILLLLLGIASHLLAAFFVYRQVQGLPLFKTEEEFNKAYMIADLFFKFSLVMSFYAYRYCKEKDELLDFFVWCIIAFIGNDLLDEFFFDPFKWQFNETILLTLIILSGIYRVCKTTMTFLMK